MITKEQVEHIATLARLALTKEEIEKFQKDLGAILDYFDTLKSVDTSKVNPMTHSVELLNALREDIAKKEKPEVVEKLVESSPASERGFIKVKEVFEEENKK